MRSLLLVVCILLMPTVASAAISFDGSGKWSTTFDCNDWTHNGNGDPNCDGLNTWLDNGSFSPKTAISSASNYPSGSGGKGIRFWKGSGGDNRLSGTMGVKFPSPQPELWIRYYFRYEEGFNYLGSVDTKEIYMNMANYSNSNAIGFYGDSFRTYSYSVPGGATRNVLGEANKGWNHLYPSDGYSDGEWHSIEIYLKMDTNGTSGSGYANGTIRVWLDDELILNATDGNWSGGNSTHRQGWHAFEWIMNQKNPGLSRAYYVDVDDMTIYNQTPPNTDSNGYAYIGGGGTGGSGSGSGGGGTPDPDPPSSSVNPVQSMDVETYFTESMENGSFSGRGWYDNTGGQVLANTGAISGSDKSIEYRFTPGATQPTSGGSLRRNFTPSDSVYVSYYVKYSDNWVGSQLPYHPHEFYLMTNKDDDWGGLAFTNLTAYIEQNALRPRLSIQDGKNIDVSNVNQDLVGVTENRAVSGCNGDSDGTGSSTCYSVGGGEYWNGKHWDGSQTLSRNDWHQVEAFFKLNSIQNGKGVADGVVRYWLDGELVLEQTNVMLRTAEHDDMKFDKIIIGPWIGDGSPVDQTFWIDELTVGTEGDSAGSGTGGGGTGGGGTGGGGTGGGEKPDPPVISIDSVY